MEIKLLVAGTVHEAHTLPIDAVMFERHWKMPISALDDDNAYVEQLLWLGWHVMRRTGPATHLDFEQFLEVVDFPDDDDDDDDEPAPEAVGEASAPKEADCST